MTATLRRATRLLVAAAAVAGLAWLVREVLIADAEDELDAQRTRRAWDTTGDTR